MTKRGLFLCVFLFLLLSGSVSFAASSWVSFGSGQLTVGQPGDLSAYPEVSLLASNPAEVILEVDFPGMVIHDVVREGMTYQSLLIPGGGRTSNLGWAELPIFGRFIAVPLEAEAQIEVLEYTARTLSGYNIYPAQEQPVDKAGVPEPEFVKDEDFYQRDEFYPDRMAFVEEPKIIRGCPVSLFVLFPVQYNPVTQELKVCSHMKVKVSFGGGSGLFVDPAFRSPYFEPLYENLLLNYSSLGTPAQLGGKSDTGCDFLIITHPDFQAWAESLASWKNLTGISTWVKSTTETGSDTGSIRTYIQNAYDTWTPPPSFLLLVGDAEFVPLFYRSTHPYDGYKTGTDLYYVAVDGSDWLPDIYPGRISVDSPAEAGVVMSKIINYQRDPITTPSSFYGNVLVAGYFQDEWPQDGYADRFFLQTSEVVRDFVLSQGYDAERCYTKTSGSNPQYYYYGEPIPPGLSWTGSATQINNAINDGVFLVNHRDHGDVDGWGDPEYLLADLDGLANQDRLPVVFSINCETGHFDNETDASGHGTPSGSVYFCEAFQRKENGGAVGIFGHTRVSFSGYNDELCKGFYDAMWTDFDPSYPGVGSTHPIYNPMYMMGAVLNFGKFWMYDKYYLTGGSGYPWTPDNTTTKATFEMGHWFGDPSMQIWTSAPESLDVTHPDAVVLGGAPFPVSVYLDGQPVENALVCLIKEAEFYEVGRTDSSGEVTLYPSPLSPGDVEITITAHNAFPYRSTILATGGAYVVFEDWSVDDDSLGESLGNGDGDVDLGETVELPIVLENVGDSTAFNVQATLSTAHPLITITDDHETYGDIGAHEAISCAEDFDFAVSTEIADGEAIAFQLDVTADNGNWTQSDLTLVAHAPILVYESNAVEDVDGNGDGEPDPGETCDMTVVLKNEGSQGAVGVTADLICDDPYVTVTVSNSSYPDIPSGSTGYSVVPYQFEVAADCSLGHITTFILQIGGAGPYSTSDTFELPLARKPVLLVDDDDGESYETYFVSAFSSLGISFDLWEYDLLGLPSDSIFGSYKAVVWTTGNDYGSVGNPSTLTPEDQAGLQTYLDNNGRLFLSSQDLLYDNDPNTFIIDYLHVAGHTDDPGINSVAGVSGDAVSDGISLSLSYPFTGLADYLVPHPDAAGIFYRTGKSTPASREGLSAVPSFPVGGPDVTNYCALRYPATGTADYQVVFFAFPFEAVPQSGDDPNNAKSVMGRIMAWFGINKPASSRGDANGDGEIDIADVMYLANYLFIGGAAPDPMWAGDANCDGEVDVADVMYLINYLFIGGSAPGC